MLTLEGNEFTSRRAFFFPFFGGFIFVATQTTPPRISIMCVCYFPVCICLQRCVGVKPG